MALFKTLKDTLQCKVKKNASIKISLSMPTVLDFIQNHQAFKNVSRSQFDCLHRVYSCK